MPQSCLIPTMLYLAAVFYLFIASIFALDFARIKAQLEEAKIIPDGKIFYKHIEAVPSLANTGFHA